MKKTFWALHICGGLRIVSIYIVESCKSSGTDTFLFVTVVWLQRSLILEFVTANFATTTLLQAKSVQVSIATFLGVLSARRRGTFWAFLGAVDARLDRS